MPNSPLIKRPAGRRFQVSTYSLKGVWFVLDMWRPACSFVPDEDDDTKGYFRIDFPTVDTAMSREQARRMATIRNMKELAKYAGNR